MSALKNVLDSLFESKSTNRLDEADIVALNIFKIMFEFGSKCEDIADVIEEPMLKKADAAIDLLMSHQDDANKYGTRTMTGVNPQDLQKAKRLIKAMRDIRSGINTLAKNYEVLRNIHSNPGIKKIMQGAYK